MDKLTPEQEAMLKKLLARADRLEQMAEQDERLEWLWGSARRLASWVAIVLGGIILLWDQIKSTAKFIARGMGL